MTINPLVGTLDTEVERPVLGYELLDEKIIVCGDCKKKLVEVIKVKESNRINYITAKCPFCGDKSFKVKFVGHVFLQSTEDCLLANFDTTKKSDNEFVSEIEVIKCQDTKTKK